MIRGELRTSILNAIAKEVDGRLDDEKRITYQIDYEMQ